MRRLRTQIDSDIWDALVQLPASYDSLYLTYGDKGQGALSSLVRGWQVPLRTRHTWARTRLDQCRACIPTSCQRYPYSLFTKSTLWFCMTTGNKESQVVYGTPAPETRRKRQEKPLLNHWNHLSLFILQSLSSWPSLYAWKMGPNTSSHATQTYVEFHQISISLRTWREKKWRSSWARVTTKEVVSTSWGRMTGLVAKHRVYHIDYEQNRVIQLLKEPGKIGEEWVFSSSKKK